MYEDAPFLHDSFLKHKILIDFSISANCSCLFRLFKKQENS